MSAPVDARTPLLAQQRREEARRLQQQQQQQKLETTASSDQQSQAEQNSLQDKAMEPDEAATCSQVHLSDGSSKELSLSEVQVITDEVVRAMKEAQWLTSEESSPSPVSCEPKMAASTAAVIHTATPFRALPTGNGKPLNEEKTPEDGPLAPDPLLIQTVDVSVTVDALIAQLLAKEEVLSLITPFKVDDEIQIDDKTKTSKMHVHGLSTVTRTSGAIMEVFSDGSLIVEAGLGVPKVAATFDYSRELGGCCGTVRGHIDGGVDSVDIKFRIKIKAFIPSLLDFDLKFGDPKIDHLTGASAALNWLVRLLANKTIVSKKEDIRGTIKQQVAVQIESLFRHVNLVEMFVKGLPGPAEPGSKEAPLKPVSI